MPTASAAAARGAVALGEYARPDERLLAWLTGIGIVLGLALLVIVVVEG